MSISSTSLFWKGETTLWSSTFLLYLHMTWGTVLGLLNWFLFMFAASWYCLFGFLVSHLILFIFEVRDFKVLVTSSSFGLYSAGLEEEGISSLYLFFSLSYFFFNFSDPRMLESTFMDASFIDNKVVDLLSLNRRENSTSNALSNVILVEASVGLISSFHCYTFYWTS